MSNADLSLKESFNLRSSPAFGKLLATSENSNLMEKKNNNNCEGKGGKGSPWIPRKLAQDKNSRKNTGCRMEICSVGWASSACALYAGNPGLCYIHHHTGPAASAQKPTEG